MSTPKPRTQFALQSRILHWLMAAMLLAMLFIGVSMVASLGDYHTLVAIHRPLGIMILVLAAIRFVNRMCTTLPPFPPTMSRQERFMASVIREVALRFDVRSAARRLGHVVGGPLPDRHVRVVSSPGDSSRESDASRRAAQDAHDSRLPAIPDVSGPPRRRAVPYADRSRSAPGPHGHLANPLPQDQKSKLISLVRLPQFCAHVSEPCWRPDKELCARRRCRVSKRGVSYGGVFRHS